MIKNYQIFEESRPHESGEKHVTGYANYTDDIIEPENLLYGAIGYDIKTTDNLFFQPNIRIGLANRVEANYSLYLNANVSGTQYYTSQDYEESESGMTLGIMLPIVYKLESLNIGAQLRLGGARLTLASGTEELEFGINSAFQITLGFNF